MELSQPKLFLFAAVSFAVAAIAFAISDNLILAIAFAVIAASLVVVSTQQSARESDNGDT